ncbi:MAG TPA: GGDEF domain-containing protein [Eubacteriales bacterium]|nr:GGDEF domain-containing protein [Eubacteriales bacterium]
MEVILRIDLNIFMAVMCLIMYFACRNMSERQMVHNRIFRWLILSNMALLLLEAASWPLDGNTAFAAATPLYHALMVALFIIAPLPSLFWALYVNCQLFHDRQKLRKEAVVLLVPAAACALLSLAAPFTGWMYTIDAGNVYQRGALYPLLAAVSLVPLLYASVSILLGRRRISKRMCVLLLLFMLPPVLGAAAQFALYGTTFLWSSVTISIFLVHSNVQSAQIYLDHLTGIFNRRQLDTYLADRIRAAQKGHPLSCILLDIDHFKDINDSLGHIAGDEALKDAAKLLQSCIRKGDFLARFGGDEFIIITDIGSEETLGEMDKRIRAATRRFNGASQRPYTLGFSIGCGVYPADSGWDKEAFIAHADARMYRDKALSARRENGEA